MDEGELLGRAIAHEIGHMLIGTPAHARVGLMRAVWVDAASCAAVRPLDWMFSGREGAELRPPSRGTDAADARWPARLVAVQ